MNIKRLLAGCAIVGFTSLALLAGAQEHQSAACKDAANRDDCMHAQMEKHMQEHEAKLHDALKLTAAQEPAWKALTDNFHQQMSAMQADRKAMPSRADMEKMSAPERLENHLNMSQKHLTMMQGQLTSLKAFYAVLTPEQQVTMNAAIKKMMWHRMHQHHGGGDHF
jgi:Spy/CpxP family protein refolding chaperone